MTVATVPASTRAGRLAPPGGQQTGGRRTAEVQLLVIAKQPIPGRVKTRLCPPATPRQAAAIAAAALADTLAAASAARAAHRTVVVDGVIAAPAGWAAVLQRTGTLSDRLTAAFADTACDGVTSLLIGMDTPQITSTDLDTITAMLADETDLDAVLGPAADGGWWCLALRTARLADVLRSIPTSRPDTAVRTLAALRAVGGRVALGDTLRDVDTASDAWAVAAMCDPTSHFARAVRDHLPHGGEA
ncbi:MAG TPA: DUF2064 domain-containing protein [Micromonosporaceae bacterium]|jgi:glycosyltransferase A (GT-A) superfamily protein (DUF2064 family)|nr:DUF2064 domain-containing protein [Micromonosporaceae bacterium]